VWRRKATNKKKRKALMVELVDTMVSSAVTVRYIGSTPVKRREGEEMVQQRSRRKVGDNSGVRERRCIQVQQKGRGTGGGSGQVGKVVRGIVTKYRRGTKWKRGTRVKGVRVMMSKERRRKSGSWVRMGKNGVVLVNKKYEPMANRSRMVMCRERRSKGYGKVLARSVYVV
jgi:large subunit ribosomal protein L14